MKLRFVLYFLILIFLSSFNYEAKNSVNYTRTKQSLSKGPKTPDEDFKLMYLDAQDLFNYEYYDDALGLFQKLLAYDNNNCNINFYIGVCILNSKGQKSKCLEYLEKAVKKTNISYSYSYKETAAPVFAYLYLGQAFHLIGKYDDALTNFEKFKTFLTNKNRDGDFLQTVERCIEMSNNAKKLATKPIKVKIEPFKAVNSTASDLAMTASPDGKFFYFSSKRKGAMGGQKDNFGEYYDDIYFTQFSNNKWAKPKKMASKINTTNSDVANCITSDGKQFYFARQRGGAYDIFVSNLSKKNKWLPPERLGININSKENDIWAYVTADGNTMLFSSDRLGGYGGYDIYMSEKLSTGEWGKPINLGSEINTANDEICPVLMPDGTLYFSSNGHETMGGYDVFESVISEDGLWSKPENMGCPLNTPNDDFNFMPVTPDGKTAYYTSAIAGGFGDADIYKITFE